IGFPPPLALVKSGVNPAMASLADTRALIIDLRRNNGGIPDGVAYVTSFFLASTAPVHLSDIVRRNPGTRTFQVVKAWSVPTPTKYIGKPVYLLTSRNTFSGGEGFAYDLQA